MRLTLAFAPLALLAALPACGGVTLVADGRPQAVVVTPAEPSSVARYAAEELVRHVELATAVKLPLAAEGSEPAQPAGRVYVGPSLAAKAAGVDAAKLPLETSLLRTAGNRLFLLGGDGDGPALSVSTPAGTLWAVYELLETVAGVRWLWPGDLGTVVPKTATLAVPDTDRTVTPRLFFRQVRDGLGLASRGAPGQGFTPEGQKAYAAAQTVFLRRHRMGRSRNLSYGHAWEDWWQRYGAEHPDWFQLRADGQRGPASQGARTSMCVTNPGFHQQIIANWLERRAQGADPQLNVNACENDIQGLCTCPVCQAADGPQPAEIDPRFGPRVVSDRYARFWLAVQQLAARQDPNALVVAYAYVNYFPKPSPTVKLNEHVLVGLVPDMFFPRSEAEQAWIKDQWAGWEATGAKLFLRPNFTLHGYAMPHVYSRQFADEFSYEVAHGMVMTDFDSLTGQWATQGPTLYLLMRLHTQPDADPEALLAEYYGGFGPAAEAVKAYWDYWERYALDHTQPMRSASWSRYAAVAHQLFPPEALDAGAALLDRAAQAAGQDRAAAARVAWLRQGLEHARHCAAVATAAGGGSPNAARRALNQLIAFRRETEGQFLANYGFCAYIENRSWTFPEGYGGERLINLAETAPPLPAGTLFATRGTHSFVAQLRAGERFRATVAAQPVGKNDLPVRWTIYDADDQTVAQGEVALRQTGQIDVPVAKDGVYTLIVASGAVAAHVTLANDHAAACGRLLRFIGPTSPLSFWVPAGTAGFKLTLESQAPGETATLRVIDPAGAVAATVATGDEAKVVAEVTPAAAQTGKAWRLEVDKAAKGVLEDYTITLDPVLPPYWAHTAERLLVPAGGGR